VQPIVLIAVSPRASLTSHARHGLPRRLAPLLVLGLGLCLSAAGPTSQAQMAPDRAGRTPAIALHPENSRYFLWRGKTTLLITSAEHYGAVLNLDFDYRRYLDTLAADGMNYTRIFTGAYVEPEGAFNITRNTLAPLPNRFIAPWARSSEPGYANGGHKFDLTAWNEDYFARLTDFVAYAGERGVVVEVTLFCPMYEDRQWRLSPMYAGNNVNGLGNVDRTSVYTLDEHGGLLPVQEALTRKIVTELNRFDNVLFEIANEPYFGGVTMAWQHRIADVIVETERDLPVTHLIAQNIANNSARIEAPHPAVSIFNFHYATPPDAVAMNDHLGKVIGNDETGFRGTADVTYRTEGWDFILAGGALYNNLDYSFAAGYEDGTFVSERPQPGGGSAALRRQLKILSDFIHGFDVVRMRPDNGVIRGGVPETGTARALVEPGRAMAVYVRDEGPGGPWSARWTGFIDAPVSGEYVFHTVSNDGIRVWVNDEPLIDDWTDHGEQEDVGRITLKAGERYPLRMEYFYNGGAGVSRLWWTPPGGEKQPIPHDAFRLPTGTGWGVRGEYFRGIDLTQPWFEREDGQIDFAYGTRPPVAVEGATSTAALQIELAPGTWHAEWVDTKTGVITARATIDGGGVRALTAPPYTADIALRLTRR
jgi:hypothetical protein